MQDVFNRSGVHYWSANHNLTVPCGYPFRNTLTPASLAVYVIRRAHKRCIVGGRQFVTSPDTMPQRMLQLPTHSRTPSSLSSHVETDKLLALPPFQHASDGRPAKGHLRIPLQISYSVLLISSSAYFAISGYASFWRTSAYIGVISGLNSVFFSTVLLITCAKAPHPLARPQSASLGARVCATLLSICWAIATAFLAAFAAGNASDGLAHSWIFAELGLSVLAFCCTLLVMGLQFAQYRRYSVRMASQRVRY